jgi:HK97 family phage prohead protease
MPWHAAKSDQCPVSKPWAVIKDSDGTIAGCHATESDADDQVAALYANEKSPSLLTLQRGSLFRMPKAPVLNRRITRSVPVEFRAVDDHPRRFLARVIQYDVVDDYDTEFAPGVFTDSLARRLPRVVWAHDWSEPLGRYIEARDAAELLDLVGEFDDFDDVPRARQAYAQLKSGTIDQFSVGFVPLDGHMAERDGREVFRFTRARLDEVSLVLAGAVPGTELLAVRSKILVVRAPAAVMPKDQAAQIILDMHEGRLDIADALMAIKTAQSPEEGESVSGEASPETPPAEPVIPSSEPASSETPPEPPSPAPAGAAPEPVVTPPVAPETIELPTAAPVVEPPATPPVVDDYSDVEAILLQHL